jgi:hypothetical protein
MFESHPDTQYIFPKFRGIDLTALEQSLVIVQHGSRVMGIVDSVVKNLVSCGVTDVNSNFTKVCDSLFFNRVTYHGKIYVCYG